MLSIRYNSRIESWRNRKTSLRAILREIIWKNNGGCCCLNCFYSFRTTQIMVIVAVSIASISLDQKNLNHIKNYVKIKIFVILCCLLKTLKY